MVTINCAYTEPINPAGTSPALTRKQVWTGLQRKIRRAQDFVPVIKACDVLEDKGNEVIREAHFADGHSVKEVCKSYWPTRVDFHQPDGAVIMNTISDSPSLKDEEMNMTYTFEWRNQDVEEGSEKHKELVAKYRKMAQMAVHSSIEALHKMAAAGELD
ncbi:hypothetical protein AMS68_001100 [Peltaster fructicola]|uniref:DUF1857-domain-containing protein n=1 Tax=Peltaster fructicola TaxID=286661 RepID=A0A6H0XLJ1_9PEZI|nr:hypothetical protein AMS68_001100 [Peltaster fructicola]